MVGTGAVDALLCADGRLVLGFPAVLAFVAAASVVVFCVSEPPAFFAVVRIGLGSRDCEAEGNDSDSVWYWPVKRDEDCSGWLSGSVSDPLETFNFFAPWRSSASSRSSSVSERGTPHMIPCFPLEDFGRLALRDLFAALFIFRKASCCEWSVGKMNRSQP